jgi:hypothetical protein
MQASRVARTHVAAKHAAQSTEGIIQGNGVPDVSGFSSLSNLR